MTLSKSFRRFVKLPVTRHWFYRTELKMQVFRILGTRGEVSIVRDCDTLQECEICIL